MKTFNLQKVQENVCWYEADEISKKLIEEEIGVRETYLLDETKVEKILRCSFSLGISVSFRIHAPPTD